MVGKPEVFNDKSLDVETPLDVPLSAKYKRSFAYTTIKDRLPVIITKVVDYLCREKQKIAEEYGEPASEELKEIIGSFSRLRNELQTNKPIVPLTGTAPDVAQWNSYLLEFSSEKGPRWFDSPWLLVECYMYRRIRQAFEKSSSLTSFDPFRQQKQEAFASSLVAMQVLGQHLVLCTTSHEMNKLDFVKFFKIALWGNKCDLSLSAGEKNDQKQDPLAQLDGLEINILVDDSDKVWELLSSIKDSKSVDIVLDNSGFELFCDLCLADILLTQGLADCVHFHVKCMPWFISDVTVPDLYWTLEQLKSCMPQVASRWQGYFDQDKWKLYPIEKSQFWTLPHDYGSMQKVDPDLFSYLQSTTLVIYKGDLNYRKLVGDRNWSPDTPFSVAVGNSPAPLVALRTLKADVVAGLQPGQAQQVAALSQDWLISGQYAVIQMHVKN